jgi:hypothetical protein
MFQIGSSLSKLKSTIRVTTSKRQIKRDGKQSISGISGMIVLAITLKTSTIYLLIIIMLVQVLLTGSN